MKNWTILAVVVLLASSPAAFAEEDPKDGFRSAGRAELAGAFQRVEKLAQKIPVELYGWRPGEGVRSVSEAIMHIAYANFIFARDLGVPLPKDLPEDLEAVTEKERVLEILSQSFKHAKTAFDQTVDSDLERQVWDSGMTARGLLLRMQAHVSEHLGQLVAYARVNGVVPPPDERASW